MIRTTVFAAALVACSSAASSSFTPPPPAVDAGVVDAGAADAAVADSGSPPTVDASVPRSSATLSGFEARAAVFRAARNGDGEALIDIVLGDSDDLCKTPRTEKLTPALNLTLRSAGAMKPGIFPVVLDTQIGGSGAAPESTVLRWTVYDAADDECELSNSAQGASGGTIEITSFTEDASIDGHFSITLDPGGTAVSGTFHALPCFAPAPEALACFLRL